MTNNRYEPELKQKVLRLYLEEGRTKKSLTEEYNLGQGTLTYWLQQYRKECDNSPTKREESDSYEVAKKLRKEIEELKKENSDFRN
jgi:transposase